MTTSAARPPRAARSRRRDRGRGWSSMLLALVGLLAACVPVTDPGRLEVGQRVDAPSFYPRETGLRWSYLAEGARLDERRFVETVEGPAVIAGDIWIAVRLVGPGREDIQYLQYRDDGVFLGRLARLGGTIDYDPPQRVLPGEAALRVGAIWSGSTVATTDFPGAVPSQRRQRIDLAYVYTVVDQRPVTVGGRVYDVFVIDRTGRTFDDQGAVVQEVSQQLWFAPGVGKVRHENGWFLVETNFEAGRAAP